MHSSYEDLAAAQEIGKPLVVDIDLPLNDGGITNAIIEGIN